jgi:hypothetical protein
MSEGRTFRGTGRSARVEDQRQVLRRVDANLQAFGPGSFDNIIEVEVMPFIVPGFWDFPQKTRDKSFHLRQARFDIADNHCLYIRPRDSFACGLVKIRVIHTKDCAGSGVFQLVIQFRCRKGRVAGYTNGPGLKDAEVNGRIMGEIGERECTVLS